MRAQPTQVVFSVFDGRQRLGHVTESTSAKKGFDIFIGDEFVSTVSTQDEARDAIFAALDGPGGAK
jgi:hypothetical protein